jgi:hypothetical protein
MEAVPTRLWLVLVGMGMVEIQAPEIVAAAMVGVAIDGYPRSETRWSQSSQRNARIFLFCLRVAQHAADS